MCKFSDADIAQIREKGLSPRIVRAQISRYTRGYPYQELEGPARAGTSIKTFSNDRIRHLVKKYSERAPQIRTVKFIPASGAATRMFGHLYQLLDELQNCPDQEAILSNKEHTAGRRFFQNLKSFAFADDLNKALKRAGKDLDEMIQNGNYKVILEYLLSDKGLDYGRLPKALVKFHRYDDHSRTPLEEHMVEGASYARTGYNKVYLHFTVPQDHLERFKNRIDKLQPKYEDYFGVEYEIRFSTQNPATDIIAVDYDNKPVRTSDGHLLFRPGGHGALIENLDNIYGHLIFIKNIDNVVPDHLRDTTNIYKRALGGYLLEIQEQVFSWLTTLDRDPAKVQPEAIRQLLYEHLGYHIPDAMFMSMRREQQLEFLYNKLNRPIRVCGMVKNTGEPGGGPYSVLHDNGCVSLQIVEKNQIDTKKEDQRNYLEVSTHFNPVDLVCSTHNHKGEPFDLKSFTDPETGIITHKTYNGKPIKAQERPGLWNGAMANWNTAFVEVPLDTFNPVKNINDLMRKEHL